MIKLITENFVAVAADDWYSRRRQDVVGEFFRKVADQGPRKGEGGTTRQGSYAFTADGKLLGYNNNQSLERRLAMVNEALEKWKALPKKTVQVDALGADKLDARFARSAPEKGVVLEAFTRTLEKSDSGMSAEEGKLAARDSVWIREGEWLDLITRQMISERLAMRILRFHCVDNTRGEPPFWKTDEVKMGECTVSPGQRENEIYLKLSATIASGKERGFDVELTGLVRWDADKRPLQFDLVAIGDHWGEGPYTRGAREGRTPLGVAFRLMPEGSPGKAVPPQGSRWEQGYYEAEKN